MFIRESERVREGELWQAAQDGIYSAPPNLAVVGTGRRAADGNESYFVDHHPEIAGVVFDYAKARIEIYPTRSLSARPVLRKNFSERRDRYTETADGFQLPMAPKSYAFLAEFGLPKELTVYAWPRARMALRVLASPDQEGIAERREAFGARNSAVSSSDITLSWRGRPVPSLPQINFAARWFVMSLINDDRHPGVTRLDGVEREDIGRLLKQELSHKRDELAYRRANGDASDLFLWKDGIVEPTVVRAIQDAGLGGIRFTIPKGSSLVVGVGDVYGVDAFGNCERRDRFVDVGGLRLIEIPRLAETHGISDPLAIIHADQNDGGPQPLRSRLRQLFSAPEPPGAA